MISSSLAVFKRRLEHIESFVSGSKGIEDIILTCIKSNPELKDTLNGILNHQRSFSDLFYSSKIVSIYGCLERYIEDVIDEYVDRLTDSITSFDKCGITTYIENAFLVGTKLHSHHKYVAIEEEKLINSMSHCVRNDSINLISEVFYSTSGNYNANTIEGSFKRLGFDSFLKSVCKWPPFSDLLLQKYSGEAIEHEKNDVLFLPIDDIVSRRNDIAHGREVLDRLSDSLIVDRVQFIRSFVEAINKQVNHHLLSLIWDQKSETYSPSKIRPRIKVVEFLDVGDCYLKKGDNILLRKHLDGGRFFYGYAEIVDIRNQNDRQIKQIKSSKAKKRSFSLKLKSDIKISGNLDICFT